MFKTLGHGGKLFDAAIKSLMLVPYCLPDPRDGWVFQKADSTGADSKSRVVRFNTIICLDAFPRQQLLCRLSVKDVALMPVATCIRAVNTATLPIAICSKLVPKTRLLVLVAVKDLSKLVSLVLFRALATTWMSYLTVNAVEIHIPVEPKITVAIAQPVVPDDLWSKWLRH
jgi:hypothetical protein